MTRLSESSFISSPNQINGDGAGVVSGDSLVVNFNLPSSQLPQMIHISPRTQCAALAGLKYDKAVIVDSKTGTVEISASNTVVGGTCIFDLIIIFPTTKILGIGQNDGSQNVVNTDYSSGFPGGSIPGGSPSGAAGGDLGGTYPNPSVAAITETAGPTQLTVGAVADGEVLTRSGATIVGTTPGGGGGGLPDPFDNATWVLQTVEDFSGFLSQFETTGGLGWTYNRNTDGLGVPTASPNGLFNLGLRTSAAATAYQALCSQKTFVFGGNYDLATEFVFKTPATLPTASIDYRLRIGFADDFRHGGIYANGVQLCFERSVSTTNFFLKIRNSSTDTVTVTGVAMAVNTVYRARIQVDSTLTNATLEIAPISATSYGTVNTVTATVPNSTVVAMFRGFEISKILGSGARTLGLMGLRQWAKRT